MNGTIRQTRQSLGSQLRDALDAMQTAGQIRSWEFESAESGGIRYRIADYWGNERTLAPGETMDWVRGYGYDVRIGKVPKICAVCGSAVTVEEERLLGLDTDFVQHGDRGHLIRVEATS